VNSISQAVADVNPILFKSALFDLYLTSKVERGANVPVLLLPRLDAYEAVALSTA
jgi:hypothetical protein